MDNFSNLPAGVISDIFSRLPAESVLDCKLVSKTWRDLIHHPSFSQMHFNRHNYVTDDSGKLGFIVLVRNAQLYYFEYDNDQNSETTNYRIRRINLTPPIKFNTFVGSFNGLICLNQWPDSFVICNPMTKEYVILPEPIENPSQCKYRWIGFGYLPSTNKYKVVLIYELENEPSFVQVLVYTLGSGHGWRNIGKFDLKLSVLCHVGIFAKETLYWIDKTKRLMVFDLVDEKFGEHLSAPLPPTNFYIKPLGVFDGFLFCPTMYFSTLSKKLGVDVWLYKNNNGNHDMKKQDEHQPLGWTKEFTMKFTPDQCSLPLSFTKSGGVLIWNFRDLNIYDPKASTSKGLLVDFKEEFVQIFHHKNTLLSLKQLGEEDTKKMVSVKAIISQKATGISK